jgi:hypothetical protein
MIPYCTKRRKSSIIHLRKVHRNSTCNLLLSKLYPCYTNLSSSSWNTLLLRGWRINFAFWCWFKKVVQGHTPTNQATTFMWGAFATESETLKHIFSSWHRAKPIKIHPPLGWRLSGRAVMELSNYVCSINEELRGRVGDLFCDARLHFAIFAALREMIRSDKWNENCRPLRASYPFCARLSRSRPRLHLLGIVFTRLALLISDILQRWMEE